MPGSDNSVARFVAGERTTDDADRSKLLNALVVVQAHGVVQAH
jgi:hypothetical protein